MISRLFGFLTGAVVAGASVYYYVLGDYRISNEMLNDDITVCFNLSIHIQSSCLQWLIT